MGIGDLRAVIVPSPVGVLAGHNRSTDNRELTEALKKHGLEESTLKIMSREYPHRGISEVKGIGWKKVLAVCLLVFVSSSAFCGRSRGKDGQLSGEAFLARYEEMQS